MSICLPGISYFGSNHKLLLVSGILNGHLSFLENNPDVSAKIWLVKYIKKRKSHKKAVSHKDYGQQTNFEDSYHSSEFNPHSAYCASLCISQELKT